MSPKNQSEQESQLLKCLKYFLAPAMVGVVSLLGQLIIQPIVAERTQTRTERWDSRRDAYVRALTLVNKYFDALSWIGPDVPSQNYRLGTLPDENAVNSCYNEIMLFTNDKKVLSAYRRCFKLECGQTCIELSDRTDLITAMRKDLGFAKIEIEPEDIRFLKWTTNAPVEH